MENDKLIDKLLGSLRRRFTKMDRLHKESRSYYDQLTARKVDRHIA